MDISQKNKLYTILFGWLNKDADALISLWNNNKNIFNEATKENYPDALAKLLNKLFITEEENKKILFTAPVLAKILKL